MYDVAARLDPDRFESTLCVSRWKVNGDFDRPIGRQFSSPTDNKVLRLLVEIPFSKWKGVECMKELRNLINSELYYIVGHCSWHGKHYARWDKSK